MKYTRILDLHITAEDGWYEFAGDIDDMTEYSTDRSADKGCELDVVYMRTLQKGLPPHGACVEMGQAGQELPRHAGLVHCPISVKDLRSIQNDNARPGALVQALNWVSDKEHVGKIRINAHGDESANFCMSRTPVMVWNEELQKLVMIAGEVDEMNSGLVANSLVDCGLWGGKVDKLDEFDQDDLMGRVVTAKTMLWDKDRLAKLDKETKKEYQSLVRTFEHGDKALRGVNKIELVACSGRESCYDNDRPVDHFAYYLKERELPGITVAAPIGVTHLLHSDMLGGFESRTGEWVHVPEGCKPGMWGTEVNINGKTQFVRSRVRNNNMIKIVTKSY
jgi:hypothetical protein